ncbi:MAG: LysR family transcriptional regulator [Burkholderiales bacterium]
MPQTRIRRYLRHGTLPQLSVFEAVARLGSFTRAGEELYLAQPTVSVQVKKLAETVGAPLFEQVGKSVHLTDAGRTLYDGCHRVFDVFAEVEAQLAEVRGLKSGRLRLAVTTAAKYFAPRLLGAYSKAHPGIDISLQIHNRQVLTERLAANADDVYVFAQPPADLEVVTEPLLANPLVVFAPADHPLARARRIPFARIAGEPFLMREPGSGTHRAVQALFEAHGVVPRVRMELSTNEAIQQAILAGLGLSILPRHTYGIGTDSKSFAILDVTGLPMKEAWHLVYAKGKRIGGVAGSFIAFARAEAAALAGAL